MGVAPKRPDAYQVMKNLSILLNEKYGKGWGYEKLKHCVRSAYLFSEDEIRYAVRTQLTWTHLRSLMSIDDELKRRFYMEMARIEHWDTPDVVFRSSYITFVSEELISERSWISAYGLTKDVDEDDTPFVALALELNTKLWTGDKTLAKGLYQKGSDLIIGTTEMKNLLK